jgi:hypothetical protein
MWGGDVKIRGLKRLAIVLVAGLLVGTCRRSNSAAPTAESASGAKACLETDPRPEIASACMACLRANAINAGNDGCCGIGDPIGRQLCEAVAACMRNGRTPTGPCNVAGDTTTCFCGTHQVDCWLPGVPNGPCVSVISAAAARNIEARTTDSPNDDQILTRYGDVRYALGRASNVASIAGAFCASECEIRR